jgi:ubiquitin-associated SH3 domain-containing protein
MIPGLGLQKTAPICIEPGLFEWLGWYPDALPDWLNADELKEAGFNININHKPFVRVEELQDRRESCEQFYMRSYYLAQSVIKSNMDTGN